jgi:hypothetical protein
MCEGQGGPFDKSGNISGFCCSPYPPCNTSPRRAERGAAPHLYLSMHFLLALRGWALDTMRLRDTLDVRK